MGEASNETHASRLQREAERFHDVARGYCRFVETMAKVPPERRPSEAIRHLCALLEDATELPSGLEGTDAEVERVAAPDFDLGAVDLYYAVADPFVRDELVVGSLMDDLADIYVDLREGIDLLAAGYASDALWHWRFNHDSHWGDHAVGALGALHRIAIGRAANIADPR